MARGPIRRHTYLQVNDEAGTLTPFPANANPDRMPAMPRVILKVLVLVYVAVLLESGE
jgi:hypothetical protein